MQENSVEKQYNLMAKFYNVLYSDAGIESYVEEFINQYQETLDTLDATSKVLDSSCGNGVKAVALKQKGINIVATDISEEMVKLTKDYAKENELMFPTQQLSWQQLPEHYKAIFDVVFCCGNSISHSLSRSEMAKNIQSLAKVTKKDGKIIFDTRNWEKVLEDHQRFHTSDIINYNGQEYMFTYIWELNGFDQVSHVEILFIAIEDSKKTKCQSITLDFMPFTHQAFLSILKKCDLKIVKDTYQKTSDHYSIIVEK